MIHSIRKIPSRGSKRWLAQATLGLALGASCAALLCAPALGADKGPQISRVIAKDLIAAQKALQASQWTEGLKNLEAAEGKTGLTPFDHKTIDDLKAFAYVKLNNMKAAQQAFEDALATGAATPEETPRFTRAVFQLSYNSQQYAKAIEYGKKLVDSGAGNVDTMAIVGQSYYLTKDCKNAVVWMDRAITSARKAGEQPKEGYYQVKLRCAYDAGDTPATIAAFDELVRLTNKSEYWNSLLRLERQDEKEDHNLLMIYRIMFNTNAMTAGSDYMEMAQLLGDAALPGEAQAALEKAVASGLITAEQKDRTTRLLASLKARADTDRKGLAQFEAESAKSPAGELYVKLGEVYYGFGDYQHAVAAINSGLQKGQVKHLDEAYVYLGLAQAQLKDSADAKKAFAALKTVPGISPRVLKLWDLYAEKNT